MAPDMHDEERRWAADKRDFVADSRDDTADERDRLADLRDRIADEREAAADARETEQDRREAVLDERAEALGQAPSRSTGQTERTSSRATRLAAGRDRESAAALRVQAGRDRVEATDRRLADDRPTLLAMAFAQIADRLYDAGTYEQVLIRIAETAVATVAGGEVASVTLRGADGYRTSGATGRQAIDVDQAQYDAGEGPCLDAFDNAQVEVPAFPDDRWPLLGSHPVEHGVQSSVSYRLRGDDGHAAGAIGSLNVYGVTPAAFDETSVEIGSILAAHASLAARAVGERARLADLGQQLQKALLSRDVIGQAKGILIERLRISPEEAFEILKRSSQRLNLRLREVALRLTETGDVDPADVGRRGRIAVGGRNRRDAIA